MDRGGRGEGEREGEKEEEKERREMADGNQNALHTSLKLQQN